MPTFLHVGCSWKRKDQTTKGFDRPEWQEIRLDIDPSVRPDIVGTMTDMSAVGSASMDAVYSSHNLEHLYPFEVRTALGEFLRVLTSEGFAVITCPDLQSVAAAVAEGRLDEPLYEAGAGPVCALDILYGHRPALARGNLYMAHRMGFTRRTLEQALRDAGFVSVAVLQRPRYYDLWALGTKASAAPARMQGLVREHFPLGDNTVRVP